MTVRLKDIARDLGISTMAVSKALRDHKDIGQKTKERVRRRAAELNYRTDSVARSMVTGRTFLVGLIVPDLKQSFFSEIAAAIARKLAPTGYHVLIAHTDEDEKEEIENLRLLASRRIDGLIVASAQRTRKPESLSRLGIPYVLVDRQVPGIEANYVGSRNEEIAFVATKHLIDQGCRRIAHIRRPALSSGIGRLRGYKEAIKRQGLSQSSELVVDGGHDDASGYRAMQQLLALKKRPDGVFCVNDPVAVGAMQAIIDAGLSIPRDIAVVGVANMHYSEMLRVPLSTVDQNTPEIGERAAELLFDCMHADVPQPYRKVLVPSRLVVRESSRRLKS